MNEAKHENFRRIAQKRVPHALKRLEMVKALAKRSAYHWTHEEGEAIIEALETQVTEIRQRLRGELEPKKEFSLPDA